MILALDEQTDALFDLVGTLVCLLTSIILIYLVSGLISLFALRILFKKADKEGWSAFIPVYNVFQMSKIATGKNTIAIIFSIFLGLDFLPYISMMMLRVIEIISESSAIFTLSLVLISLMGRLGMLSFLGTLITLGFLSYFFVKSYGKEPYMCRLSIFFAPIIFIIIGFNKNTEYTGAN